MRPGIATLNDVNKVYDTESMAELDGAVNVELPNMELMTVTYKGAGVGGEITIPVPSIMSSLSATISFPTIYGPGTKFFEIGTTRTLDFRNQIVVMNKDTHAPEKVPDRWILKGVLGGANPGAKAAAEAGDAQVTMQIFYIHHFLDGDDIMEWDPFKGIFTVNGKDLMAETRRNVFVG